MIRVQGFEDSSEMLKNHKEINVSQQAVDLRQQKTNTCRRSHAL